MKQIIYGNEARKALEKGAMSVVDAVKLTLGPKGRNVILARKYTTPLVTNDGVTIAKDISLPCPFENMGASLIKEASIKTNDMAGDGTTTATILAGSMIKEGQKNIAFGGSVQLLNQGIKEAVNVAVKHLESIAKPVASNDDIKNVATISASDSEIGSLIASAFEKVSRDGTVSLADSGTFSTYLDVVEGLSFDKGYLSPYMVTNPERMTSELNSPYILVTDKKINTINEILPLLEAAMHENRSLLIIAEDVDKDVLSALVVNKLRGTLLVNAVKAPYFGEKRKEALEDIATLTNATFISSDLYTSFASVTASDLGSAASVKITKDSTSIIGGQGEKEKIENLKNKIKYEISVATDDYKKTSLEERLSKLASGIAVIRVGAATEVEAQEKKLRVEDAISAVKASLKKGIVSGGGTAYLSAKKALEPLISSLSGEKKMGAEIVANALEEPFKQIIKNAGQNAGTILAKLSESADPCFGYNALTNEFGNMFSFGIIDPAEVEICALLNSASVATTLLTTECLVADIETNSEDKQ